MIYNRLPDLDFAWSYDEIQAMPLFMKEEVYTVMDEFIEQEKKKAQELRNKGF